MLDIMGPGKINAFNDQESLQVFFYTLLTVKTHRISRTAPAHFQCVRGGLKVILGLDDPLTSDSSRSIIFAHKEAYLPDQQVAQQCRQSPYATRSHRE